MTLSLVIPDYVVIATTLLVSAGIGVFFRFTGGKQKTTEEYLMAGRNMSIYPVAISLMATYLAASSMLGTTAEIYNFGTHFFLFATMPLGVIVAAYVFLPVFFDMGVTTAYEYLEKRFGKVSRSIVSFLFTLQMILCMGVVLYAPALALNAVTDISTWMSSITMVVICTFYCSLGGLKAVLWTDVFQSFLMYVPMISMAIKATMTVGGTSEVFKIATEGERVGFAQTSPDFTIRYTMWNTSFAGIVFSASLFGTSQAQVQRILSVGSLKSAQRAVLLSIPLFMTFLLLCCFDGILIYALFHDCDPMLDPNGAKLTSPDQMLPYSLLKMFNHLPGFSGLCIAGIFSASLSTISSIMNSMTSVTMEDFIRPYCFCKRLSESWAAFLAKMIAIAYGGLCLLLTYVVAHFSGLVEASVVMYSTIAGPVLGIFSLGMLTTTANQEGSLIGLFVGVLLTTWMGFGSFSAANTSPHLPLSIDGCMNDTIKYNNSSFSKTFDEVIAVTEELLIEENYIFPLYKVAFMWLPAIGTLTTIIVGYISSFIIKCFRENPTLQPEYISPVVRRWFFKAHEYEEKCKIANENEAAIIYQQVNKATRTTCV